MKSKGIAYLLLIFFGLFGAHRFYIGKIGSGVLYLCTFGLFYVGVVIDLFTLGTQVDLVNLKAQGSGGGTNKQGQDQGQAQAQNIVVNVMAPPSESTQKTPDSVPEVTQLPKDSESKMTLPEISSEKQILAITQEFPIISMKDVLTKTSLELDEATASMARLVTGGVAKEIDVSGDKHYDFT
jgi:TM2 domain-containing membrane protein YozV